MAKSPPLREFVSRAYIGAKQVFSRPTLILDVVRKRSLKALYLPDRRRLLIDSSLPKLKWRWSEATRSFTMEFRGIRMRCWATPNTR